MKLVLASGNAGKLREFSQLFASDFADLNVELIAQQQLNVDDAEETGLSFIENAILKARHASAKTGLPALADDSGLAIDALNGAPGIYSARYSGAGDQANIDLVLERMQGVNDENRQARFHCCLAYLRHAEDPNPQIFQGVWQGQILHQRSGEQGFGYDPIFYVPSENCSAAELSKDRKNQLSHRGLAVNLLRQHWRP